MAKFELNDGETIELTKSSDVRNLHNITSLDSTGDNTQVRVTLDQLETLANGFLAYVKKEKS